MQDLLKRYVLIVIGNLLVASAVVFFILPLDILSGGVATVAIVLSPVFHIDRVLLISILNIGLFVVGALCLGKRFALRSFLSTILYPVFISLLSMIDIRPFETVEPILAAIYAGILMGVGLGLVFRADSSTGGMDIPALILHKYCAFPQSFAVMLVDALTIFSGLYRYGLNSVLLGMISVIASSFSINYTQTLGSQAAKNMMIISEKWPEIQQFLLEEVSRGVTVLDGKGAWSNEKRPVLMCVVSDRQYARLQSRVAAIDPKAFIIVNSVHEVRGSGFTFKDGQY